MAKETPEEKAAREAGAAQVAADIVVAAEIEAKRIADEEAAKAAETTDGSDVNDDAEPTSSDGPTEEEKAAAEIAAQAVAIAEKDESGLKYIVKNFRITHEYRKDDGTIREVAFNEGDIMMDDGSDNTLPHDSIMSLLASGHIVPAE